MFRKVVILLSVLRKVVILLSMFRKVVTLLSMFRKVVILPSMFRKVVILLFSVFHKVGVLVLMSIGEKVYKIKFCVWQFGTESAAMATKWHIFQV